MPAPRGTPATRRPSKTSVVGPVIQTPSSRQSIAELAAVEPHRHPAPGQPAPRRHHRRGAGAGAAGQRDHAAALPDPHADGLAVDAPGRTRRWCAPGTAGRARSRAPTPATSTASASGTTKTQCGLPMPTAPGVAGERQGVEVHRAAPAAPRPSRARGGPMLTRISPPPASSARSTPRPVRRSSAVAPLSSISSRATQRVALPQASAGVPSAFQKSTSAATPAPGADHRQLVEADAAVAVAERARQRRRHRRAAARGRRSPRSRCRARASSGT